MIDYLFNQGEKGSLSFQGKSDIDSSKLFYGQSAKLFSEILRSRLKNDKEYSLLDLGSYKGELLGNILKFLNDFKFDTIAIDLNEEAIKENIVAKRKIVSDLDDLPLNDKEVGVTIMRYVLQWNPPEKQKRILSEIGRVTRKLAIIQHIGVDFKLANEHKVKINNLFTGEITRLKRLQEGMFFSSNQEVEKIMEKLSLKYKKVDELRVDGLSNTVIDKYMLDAKDSQKVKNYLEGMDYLVRTTWIIDF